VRTLLAYPAPPFGGTIFSCLILTIFVPIAAQVYKYGNSIFDPNVLASLAVIVCLTIVVFLLVEGIFLHLLGINIRVRELWSTIAYCVTPLILALWLIYLFNYLAMHRLTLITLFLTGLSPTDDKFLRIVPIAMFVAQLNILVVFYHCVRYAGQISGLSAFVITLFSLVPFYAALLISLSLAELIRPGTFQLFNKILLSPAAMTYFRGG
jgi:hypothetical protein